jgi:hypothetical protein
LEAAAFVDAFSQLASDAPGTRLTWVVPAHVASNGLPPIDGLSLDSGLGQVVERANAIIKRDELPVVVQDAWGIESVTFAELESKQGPNARVVIQVNVEETLPIPCDHVVNCADALPDWRFADAVNTRSLWDFRAAEAGAPENLIATHEPHYYVLGSKSLASGGFLSLGEGLQQIRSAFGYIGGRAELDLYSTVVPQG